MSVAICPNNVLSYTRRASGSSYASITTTPSAPILTQLLAFRFMTSLRYTASNRVTRRCGIKAERMPSESSGVLSIQSLAHSRPVKTPHTVGPPSSAQLCGRLPLLLISGDLDRDYELLFPTLRPGEGDDIDMEELDRLSDESLELSGSEPSEAEETTDEEDEDLPNVGPLRNSWAVVSLRKRSLHPDLFTFQTTEASWVRCIPSGG